MHEPAMYVYIREAGKPYQCAGPQRVGKNIFLRYPIYLLAQEEEEKYSFGMIAGSVMYIALTMFM